MKKIILSLLLIASIVLIGCEPNKYTSVVEAHNDRVIYQNQSMDNFMDVMVKPDTMYYYTNGYTYSYTYTVMEYEDGTVFFVLDKICGIVLKYE